MQTERDRIIRGSAIAKERASVETRNEQSGPTRRSSRRRLEETPAILPEGRSAFFF
jgi:hypothetical protein